MVEFARRINVLLATGLLALLPAQAWGAESTLFYAVGHQDDWQLFMNPNAYHDARIEPNTKVVFIYTTAGDAGRNDGPLEGPAPGAADDPTTPYYVARENGAIEAARFIATRPRSFAGDIVRTRVGFGELGSPPRRRFPPVDIPIAGRWWLPSVTYNNTVSYFLRLPDGFSRGHRPSGSLQRLWDGGVDTLTDIHDRYTYTKEDLIELLQEIIRREAAGSTNVWINIPYRHAEPGDGWIETDPPYQERHPEEDHSDHIYTGRFMYQASQAFSCINRAEFYGYQTALMEQNLTRQQLIWEAATWGATIAGLMSTDGAWNTFDDGHNAWLGTNHFRRFLGSGPCTPESF